MNEKTATLCSLRATKDLFLTYFNQELVDSFLRFFFYFLLNIYFLSIKKKIFRLWLVSSGILLLYLFIRGGPMCQFVFNLFRLYFHSLFSIHFTYVLFVSKVKLLMVFLEVFCFMLFAFMFHDHCLHDIALYDSYCIFSLCM